MWEMKEMRMGFRVPATPVLLSSDVSEALPNVVSASLLDGSFPIRERMVLSDDHQASSAVWLCFC